MADCQSLSIFHHSKQAHTLHEESLASSADWLVYPGKTTWRMMQMGWGTGLVCCAPTRLCIAVGTPGQRPPALRVCKPGSVLSLCQTCTYRGSTWYWLAICRTYINDMNFEDTWIMNMYIMYIYIMIMIKICTCSHVAMITVFPPPSKLAPYEGAGYSKCSTESWRLSKVLCWCRHSFPSRFHDRSCTTITLKSSQPNHQSSIKEKDRGRKQEKERQRERERENVRARSWSKHLLGGRCPGEEALRPLLCLVLLPLICLFLPGPSPPDLLWSTYFHRSSFQCYYTSEQTQAFCNLHLLIPLSESSITCR